MTLRAAKWHDLKVAKAFGGRHSDLTTAELNRWKAKSENPPEATSKSGIKSAAHTTGSFYVLHRYARHPNEDVMVIRNGKLLVRRHFLQTKNMLPFICELNGVLVTDVQEALKEVPIVKH